MKLTLSNIKKELKYIPIDVQLYVISNAIATGLYLNKKITGKYTKNFITYLISKQFNKIFRGKKSINKDKGKRNIKHKGKRSRVRKN